jgi:hypothetical protein
MTARLKAFGRFWYDFVIGDDWTVAAGVVIALAVVALVSRTSVPAWWILPVAVAILLPMSVWRATRALRHEESASS